jgi:sugar lactone lactonase YvrE
MQEVEHVIAANCELGEGPLWHPDEQLLYWTDILNNRIHSLDPLTGQHSVYDIGLPVGSFGFRRQGGFILAAKDALAYWHPAKGIEVVHKFPEIQGTARFNDGKVDPQGRFWAGWMSEDRQARLYRLDSQGNVAEMESGIEISNGLGWSPDQTRMYYTDTPTRTIRVYDFDPEMGEISGPRPFVHVPESTGYPDGLAVDAEGCVWSAMWGGWRVVRYTPDGEVDREIRLPVERVSSCSFGGPDLDELYITTAQQGMPASERRLQPQAGDIFRYRAGVRGLEVSFFAG